MMHRAQAFQGQVLDELERRRAKAPGTDQDWLHVFTAQVLEDPRDYFDWLERKFGAAADGEQGAQAGLSLNVNQLYLAGITAANEALRQPGDDAKVIEAGTSRVQGDANGW
jgi:hypothetical protein